MHILNLLTANRSSVSAARLFFIWTALLLLFFCPDVNGQTQQTDSSGSYGSIKGVVYDSAYNFALNSSSIALYKTADSSLLNYTLPNNFGEFSLKPLPINTNLQLVISHVGYKSLVKKITIANDNRDIDLGKIFLDRKDENDSTTTENEVIVTSVLPMRMNGDTLEFNADAFRMDKNATAEDLMRRLPGFTIWGDGEMTFNGKPISSLLVNGKAFIGGSADVAAQNISKDAVQKIQVYQQANDKNPLDSTMHANIKLKEDKQTGSFGKLSAGYGSRKTYALDGMMGWYGPKLQISAVAATNNVNKVGRDINQLIRQSSYKGTGASIDYQPDFRAAGVNKPIAGGVNFQYDYIKDPTYYKSRTLRGSYFLSRDNVFTERNTTTNTLVGKDSLLIQENIATSKNIQTNQNLEAVYENRNDKMQFSLRASGFLNESDQRNESEQLQEQSWLGLTGSSSSLSSSSRLTKGFTVGSSYRKNERRRKSFVRVSDAFNIDYNFSLRDVNGNSENRTNYISFINPAENRTYNRLFTKANSHSVSNKITLDYPNLKKLIFGKMHLWDLGISFNTEIGFDKNKTEDHVADFDAASSKYVQNNYLTNKTNADIFDIKAGIRVSKTFYKQLTNRYFKGWIFNLNMVSQYYQMEHKATQTIQNFNYSYHKFIPSFVISRFNNQYGAYDVNYGLNYNTSVQYPTVMQIAPLIDSTNIWFMPKGNPNIKPQYNRNLNFHYNYSSRKPKNPASVRVNIGYRNANDFFADSSYFDEKGVRSSYVVNTSGYNAINGSIDFRKSLQIKKHTYQFGVNTNASSGNIPQYITAILRTSKNFNGSGNVSVVYSFKDLLSFRAEQGYNYSQNKQAATNSNTFISRVIHTMVSGSLQLPKNLTWSSNVSYNRSSINSTNPINFTIWNASLTYRFLKTNSGEIKFSALDLLKQNKSIINTGTANSQTFGYQNTLQNYYMITFSYFPRKFGR